MQKREDYRSLYGYLRKYCRSLARAEYPEERMEIYSMEYELELLTEYRDPGLRDSIVNRARRLTATPECWR